MDIFILRHGKAEKATPGGADRDRALTPEGREALERVLDCASAARARPSLILSSPYRRALETAQIATERLRYDGLITTVDELTPEASPYATWDEIRAHYDEDGILLATHEPLASSIAAFLLNSPALNLDVKPGTLIAIKCDGVGMLPRGALKWMITPATAQKS
jgi:phosphohistidine phosphatase